MNKVKRIYRYKFEDCEHEGIVEWTQEYPGEEDYENKEGYVKILEGCYAIDYPHYIGEVYGFCEDYVLEDLSPNKYPEYFI